MPVTIKDYDDGYGVVICGSGIISDPDRENILAHHAQSSEKLSRYQWTLSDFGDTEGSEITPESFKEVVRSSIDAADLGDRSVVAFVGSSDFGYGLSRLFEGLIAHTERNMEVFRRRSDAVAWIRHTVGERYCKELIESSEDGR